jgi:hypothetical protein
MAKGFISDTTLTAIADAIREKTGSTEQMMPGEMADLIRSIAGDGVLIKAGTFQVASDQQSVTIEHGLGKVPAFAIVGRTSTGGTLTKAVLYVMRADGSTTTTKSLGYYNGSLATGQCAVEWTNAGVKFKCDGTGNMVFAKSNYFWMAGV